MAGKDRDRKQPKGTQIIHSTFRTEEMRWLGEHRQELERDYPGEWLALDGPTLIAHGKDLHLVIEEAKAQGVDNPFLSGVRAKEWQNILRLGPYIVDRDEFFKKY